MVESALIRMTPFASDRTVRSQFVTRRQELLTAFDNLRKWLDENGYSYGAGSVMHPVPVLKGDFIIAKWKNLTRKEIAQLDGKIDGNFREGPVTVTLKVFMNMRDPCQWHE